MTGPWYRWHWLEGEQPSVVMDYLSQEEAERDLHRIEPDPEVEFDDTWFEQGVSFETDMLSDDTLREALRAYKEQQASLDIAALEEENRELKEEVHSQEHRLFREFMHRWRG